MRNAGLFLQQVAIAASVALLWKFLGPYFIKAIPEKDKDIILNLMLLAAVPFAVLGGEIIKRTWDAYSQVVRAVL